jgi:hypothetical protein
MSRGEASGEEEKEDCTSAWQLPGIRTGQCDAWATRGGREGRWHGRSGRNCHSMVSVITTDALSKRVLGTVGLSSSTVSLGRAQFGAQCFSNYLKTAKIL